MADAQNAKSSKGYVANTILKITEFDNPDRATWGSIHEYGYFEPCHTPGKTIAGAKGYRPITYTGHCLCILEWAKASLNGYPGHPKRSWRKVDEHSRKLLRLRKLLHSSQTGREKEISVCLYNVVVPTYEETPNQGKYTIIGCDAQPSNEADSLGISNDLPPLCEDCMAVLVGQVEEFGVAGAEREKMYSQDFTMGCLKGETLDTEWETADGVPTVGSFFWGRKKSPTLTGYRSRARGNLILDHTCHVFVMKIGYLVTGMSPVIPELKMLYMDWQTGGSYAVTRSLHLKPVTYAKCFGAVNRMFAQEGRPNYGGFTIADHRIKYVDKLGNANPFLVVNLRISDAWAYMVETEKDGMVERWHCTNGIMALEVEDIEKTFFNDLISKGFNGDYLPKRQGQLFMGHTMARFHPGMRTFFECKQIGRYQDNSKTDGMYLLLKKELEKGTEEEANAKQEAVHTFIKKLVDRGKQELSIDESQEVEVTVACCLRQTRFDTYARERTAPLVEMSYAQHEEMRANKGKCVYFLIPLCKDGLFVRFFRNRDDNRGILIKVMPTTMLMYPSPCIMELGRTQDIGGHRHLVVKIMYTHGQEPAFDMEDAEHEYPHLVATMEEVKEATPEGEDWETRFRFVTESMVDEVPAIPTPLSFLESKESVALDDLAAG